MIPAKLARLYENLFLNRRTPVHSRSQGQGVDCFMAYTEVGGYCIPHSQVNSGPAQAILEGGVWEPELLDFIIQNHNDKSVVHAGAFFGDSIPTLAMGIWPNVLWAFEPAKDFFACAHATKVLNHLTNVWLYNVALSDGPRKCGLIDKGSATQVCGGNTHWMETIDAYVASAAVGVIHLDVEGYEDKALAGAATVIKRDRPIIIVEEVYSEVSCPFGYHKAERIGHNTVLRP